MVNRMPQWRSLAGMTNAQPLHFIDPSSRSRAELARLGFDLGHHSEVYGDLDELAAHPPRDGIILARDDDDGDGIASIIPRLGQIGVSLPVVAMAQDPAAGRIVAAIKAGALDYLAMPIQPAHFARVLARISAEAESYTQAQQRMIEARSRIANLSVREREVLDWLTRGSSNKIIARELEIGPRTVEIHRANMMAKLGATHAAEAVRLKLEARLGEAA